MRALSDSHGLQKCKSKNIKRKITHVKLITWVKSLQQQGNLGLIRQAPKIVSTRYRTSAKRLFLALQSFRC